MNKNKERALGLRTAEIKEEPDSLMGAIGDNIEAFVSNVRRGKLGVRDGRSFSTTAACETVQLMHTIVSLFKEYEERRDSIGNQMLQENYPADVVATTQVKRLLWLISFAGEAVLRAQFGTLLLTNVTRRVLSFIRSAATENTASVSELEALAEQHLNELGRSESDEDEFQLQRRSCSRCEGRMSSPQSLLGSEERLQRPLVSRKGLSQRFTLSSAELDKIIDHTHSCANDDEHEPHDTIMAIGIPGKQTLRRAPDQREAEDVESETQFPVRLGDFLESVLERIQAFRAEIEGMCEELCSRAPKQLHATDTVITLGSSNTTRHYLLHALKSGVAFKVIILETGPHSGNGAQQLAAELANHTFVQVLPDSSAFAVMGTCTKALIGVESVLANGGLLAPIGTHPLCIAAKHFAVPVLVATITLKMSPYYPRDAYCTSLVKISRSSAQEIPWNTYGSPGDVLSTPYGVNVDNVSAFTVHSPVTEYVPPELITLYATNESEYTPSQIHRVVRENYNPED
ncbi:putative translation initiation factor eif-2b beta subunit, putative,eIF-2B GDP-GTP exchange factor [Trypanosoma theileri]|uniref:Translation initiation factor eIF2B subunit beta n=1 Tax=Trypanosoma theileri TaxID=67003 RepID=A0A1X0NQN7_9TRYP|nr:putative translation initiation factor eif-2b beta subunit, putative,eIF-2B GDP-GTP exchange factor [Trypanosoma theileri]ORC86911.1 putative translation initiation factor eif-2b beta subunit, putative,eIF-2B GDP-GTP exchange factor [Trypanosoma theileri]